MCTAGMVGFLCRLSGPGSPCVVVSVEDLKDLEKRSLVCPVVPKLCMSADVVEF